MNINKSKAKRAVAVAAPIEAVKPHQDPVEEPKNLEDLLTAAQAILAIRMILAKNNVSDSIRVESIYKQMTPKEQKGSVQVKVFRPLLALKVVQIMFKNSDESTSSAINSRKSLM